MKVVRVQIVFSLSSGRFLFYICHSFDLEDTRIQALTSI